MIHELRLFFIALQFLTRVPAPRWVGFEPAWLNQSARHFPAVGLGVGAASALVLVAGHALFGTAVAVGLAMTASVLITGAFHEDGFADTCDALGGAVGRERALEIMKDSRTGAFGVLALVLAVAAKVSLLALLGSIDARMLVAALVLAHVLSRGWPLVLIRLLPYVGDAAGSKAKPMAEAIGGGALAGALAWTALAAGAGAWLQGPAFVLAPLCASALALAWMARLFRRRLQGFTGDCLGATQQVCELACYLGIALAAA